VRVVAVNIAPFHTLEEWRAFWRETGAGDVLWAQDADGAAIRAFNINALGVTIVVDRRGRVIYRDEGPTPYERLRAAVDRAL